MEAAWNALCTEINLPQGGSITQVRSRILVDPSTSPITDGQQPVINKVSMQQ